MVFARVNIAALKTPAPKLKADSPSFLDARTKAEAVAEAAAQNLTGRRCATKEYGGPKGLEPTRYGDWEKAGRCFDF